MSYPLENPDPHFIPMDIVRVKESGNLMIIQEVNCNTCQTQDEYQWSYSCQHITEESKKEDKCAWYDQDELELVNNLYSIFEDMIRHPMGSSRYTTDLTKLRRKA